MLEPNVVHCFRKECDRVIKIMRLRLPSPDRTSICTGWSLSISTMSIDWGKPTCRRAKGALSRSNRTEERATS